MKKFSSLLLTTIMVCGLFVSSLIPVSAGIEGQVLDQAYEAVAGSGSVQIFNYSDMWQGFKPTKNRITSVETYLKFRKVGSTVNLSVLDVNGQVLGTESHALTVGGDGWETFAFESPYVTVTPEDRHSIKLSVNDNITHWGYNGDGYSRGYFAKFNPDTNSNDALFRIYGLDVTQEAPAEDTTDGDTPASNDSQTPSSSSLVKTGKNIAPENSEIGVPVLSYVEVDGEKVESTEEAIELKDNETLKVFGKAPKDMRVALFVGENSFSVSADKDGNWNMDVDQSVIEEGEYDVTAQTQTDDGKGSKVVDFFKLNRTMTDNEVAETAEKELSLWDKIIGPWQMYVMSGLLAMLVVLLIVLHFTQKKHLVKHANKLAGATKKEEETSDMLDKLDKITEAPRKRTGKKFIDINK